jgi:hypothetical protein
MPTHRGVAQVDTIQWRNLLRDAEKQLIAGGARGADAKQLH